MDLEVETSLLEIQVNGGSDINLTGSAGTLRLKASGGSDFKGKSLKVQDAEIDVNGASDARIFVVGELRVKASGASDVYYKGNPTVEKPKSKWRSRYPQHVICYKAFKTPVK